MYLWQSPVVIACHGLSPEYRLIVTFVGSYVLAMLSWYGVEQPILRRLRRNLQRPAQVSEMPASVPA
jgi:peptidoglycan/LPS O-acetylase OafA/YrhL